MKTSTRMKTASIALAVAMLPSLASAQDADAIEASPVDPVAEAIVSASAQYLATLPAVSFRWFMTSDEVINGREKITYISSGSTEMVRGQGFAAKTEREDTQRNYYFDGNAFAVSSPGEGFYATADFSGSYEDLVAQIRDSTGEVLPVWSILSSDLPDRLFEGVSAAAYLGTKLVEGHETYHIAVTGVESDWQIWILTDQDRPLPLMLIGTRTDLQGWPQFRVNFSEWDTSPKINTSDFRLVPGVDDERITLPWLPKQDVDPASDHSGTEGH